MSAKSSQLAIPIEDRLRELAIAHGTVHIEAARAIVEPLHKEIRAADRGRLEQWIVSTTVAAACLFALADPERHPDIAGKNEESRERQREVIREHAREFAERSAAKATDFFAGRTKSTRGYGIGKEWGLIVDKLTAIRKQGEDTTSTMTNEGHAP